MAEIVVKITKEGTATVTVNGVSGPGCKTLSSSIEKVLGQTTEVELTAEYYQEAQNEGQSLGQQ